MILVDDAGWGSPVGGCLIAAYRVETHFFHWEEVPVNFFQGQAFIDRAYLDGAALAAKDAIAVLGPTPGEPIHICSGYVHTETHRQHPDWKIVKIKGPFQAIIEKTLKTYLHGLGFPYQGSTEEYGKLFYEAIRWLKGGNPNRPGMDPKRVLLAKSGWRTFPAYRDYPYRKAIDVARALKRRPRFGDWNGEEQ